MIHKSHRFQILFVGIVLTALSVMPVHGQKKKRGDDNQAAKHREAEFYLTEGEKYFILEDYAKALTYYERALEANPESGTLHYKIADVLSKSDKQEDLLKASVSIEKALKYDRTNKYFFLSAAMIYNSLGKFDEAAAAYEEMLASIKGTEEYLYELAAVYQYAHKEDAAIKTYDRAEKVFGVNDVSSVQKIRLYLEKNKLEECIEEGEKLLAAFPGEESYVMAFAEVLSQKGYHSQAIQYLETFIAENTEAGNAMMLLAGFYRDNDQEEKARPLLLELFKNPSVEVSGKLIVLGAYNAELNDKKTKGFSDPEKAKFVMQLFELLREAAPDHPAIHIIGGDLYLATGESRLAQEEYLKSVEEGEVSFEVWENLIYLEIQLEEFDKAIAHAEEALEMYPNQGMIHYFHGFAHSRKRNFQDAIHSFETAKRLSSSKPPFLSEINSMLGDAYHAVKNHVKSDEAYEEALAFNPNNAVILNNYSYYLAVRKENLDKAEKMSGTLVKNYPDNATFLDTHAWVLFVREKYKDARKMIEKAIETGKANATQFEHYGDILYKLGDVDGAVEQWEKARGLNAKSESLNKKIANRKIYE
ncbi:MAG TPA: tetratricopeptide repeat protein [Chryseosolibacter sp.]|nr:tetratricopeptide repeat protein [Chryseosolibacter sp.]